MDVNSQNFWLVLPGLLQSLADCDFAVIDLEMSGGVTDRDDSRYSGLSGKELSYAMAAHAATQYNILEFGLTLIKNPKDKNSEFVTTTYNFAVNNLFFQDTRDEYIFQRSQERVINFSVTALDFFKKKGVDPMTLNGFEGEHRAGVPFLSRKEREEAIEQAIRDRKFTRKRRVRVSAREATIKKQSCLSIVFEALCGGNFLDLIDTVELSVTLAACPGWRNNIGDLQRHLNKCQTALRAKRPVLVGHNMVYDLTFLYDAFVGCLPATLAGFQFRLLAIFPRIIDTKVLAVHINHVDGNDPLGALYNDFKHGRPEITHALGFGYNVDQGRAHSAGFDSESPPHPRSPSDLGRDERPYGMADGAQAT
ncbi:uncharacterized protein VDAG_06565 [Verticillium dahliae VdLs.17]|uniref:Uncharacterized protein n=1 Tax=Verticillium dahliae (strain VdLs.17 / ATCC MYA-4575 / FGSC 10137) TaxID=498257 RepID=G2X7V7_VERDV|nr:uncharacterized protein VDAG_06565 [Verticillium dahliae VdLs.17]EGY15075.1 hypothetical protein VDAG_06565 [Verticillium dahliae VdLs.17]